MAQAVRGAARLSTRRPKLTVLLWILLIVGCTAAGAATGTNALSDAEGGVGDSGRAEQRIADSGLRSPDVETVMLTSGDRATTAAAARATERELDALPDVETVQGPWDEAAGDALQRDDGRTVLVRATLREAPEGSADGVEPVLEAVDGLRAAHPDVEIHQVGPGSFQTAIDGIVSDDLLKAELISVPVTLLVLVIAFGALVAALVPLLLGVTAVAGALGALGVVSQIAPSDDTTASLVVLIGLAVGVDYSLFYVRRERELRRRSGGERMSPEQALDVAAATVGRAILVSGVTVMLALAGLLVTGIAAFTSMALGTIVVVAIALLGSLTVLPAVLTLLGDRIDRGRVPLLGRRRERRERDARRAAANGRTATPVPGVWDRIATAVTGRPKVALVVAVVVLGGLAAPALGMKLADPGVGSLPADVPAVQAQKAIERAFPGAPASAALVVSGTDLGGDDQRRALAALGREAERITGGSGAVDVQVSDDARTALLAVAMPDQGTDAASAAVRELRDRLPALAERVGPDATVLVGGEAASSLDFVDALQRALPLVLGLVLGLAFVLLLVVFRSPALVATVVGLNLLSIGAAYGVMTAVFQSTWAESLLGFTSTGTIVSWLPLITFVILFGLSMDYSILVLERIREERLAGHGPRDAAARGVAATAGTVTSAAVVMVAVFSIFAMLRLVDMKMMGVGLAAAILLDATLVRAVALPAAVTLLGKRGFRVPSPAARPAVAWEDQAVGPPSRPAPYADVR
ncbi:MAG: MMPL family transporter [Patulibacter sp.]